MERKEGKKTEVRDLFYLPESVERDISETIQVTEKASRTVLVLRDQLVLVRKPFKCFL